MNKTELTIDKALRAIRYMSFMIVTLGLLMAILTWGFLNVDEKTQLTTSLLMSGFLVIPHLTNIYDWLTKKALI